MPTLKSFTSQLKSSPLGEFEKTLSIGFLVYIEENKEVYFQDAYQKLHSLSKVDFLTTKYNSDEGKKELPRPYIINDKEMLIKQHGDKLLYGFINNADDNIIVFGSLRNLKLNSFEKLLNVDIKKLSEYDKKADTASNEKRYYALHDDGEGGLYLYLEGKEGEKEEENGTGNLIIKIKGTKKNGIAKLETNGIIAINQVEAESSNNKIIAQVLIDNTKDAEKIEVTDQFQNIITINKEGITVKSKEKINIDSEKEININAKEKATITSKESIIKSDKATINSKDATITGGELKVKGKSTPNGRGVFCALPNGQCIFSGAVITSDTVEGT
jgi:hypothetical protein